MSYEEKIKKEIFAKLRELREIMKEKNEIEENIDYTYDEIIQDEDLVDEYIDYLGLCSLEMEFEDDVKALLFDTKYMLLSGLTHSQLQELSYHALTINPEDPVLWEKVKKLLDCELLNLESDIKKRAKRIRPLLLITHIDSKTNELYREVVKCYVYGMFKASHAFCRVIAEAIVYEYIGKSRLKHLIGYHGEKKNKKNMPSLGKILKELSVDKKTVDIFYKIQDKSNYILHNKDITIEEKDSLNSIKLLQSFIKKFYNTPELLTEWV